MAATFRNKTSGTAAVGVGSITLAKPTGTASGDGMVAGFSQDTSAAATITWPAAFTALAASPQISTVDGQTLSVAKQIAGGSEPANYTISSSDTSELSAFVAAWSGTDGTTLEDVAGSGTSQGTSTTPATFDATGITTVTDGCALVHIGASDLDVAGTETWTDPTGFTNRVTQGSARNFFSLWTSDKPQATHGATGTVSGSDSFTGGGNTGRLSFLLALRPASSGVSGTVADTLTPTDAQSVVTTFNGTLTDTLTPADAQSVVTTFNGTLADTLTATDAQSVVTTFNGTLADTLTLTDDQTATVTSGGIAGTVADTLTLVDAQAAAVSYAGTVSDTLTLVDNQTATSTAVANPFGGGWTMKYKKKKEEVDRIREDLAAAIEALQPRPKVEIPVSNSEFTPEQYVPRDVYAEMRQAQAVAEDTREWLVHMRKAVVRARQKKAIYDLLLFGD